jgi:hypothetical protein
MTRRVALLVVLVACGPGGGAPDARTNRADARAGTDAPPGADAEPSVDATPPPDANPNSYRHTITLDGTNDFAAADTFATTSAGYTAYVSWDDTNVYVGYQGPDVDPASLDTATKWIFVHLDPDPGAGTGEAHSLTYNTQRATFPAGFGSDYYYRWKCDTTFASLEVPDGLGGWTTLSTTIAAAHQGDYLEVAIPRVTLGDPLIVGIETWMINEKPDFEGTFAGLYATNFTDGYHADLQLGAYLRADFTAPEDPNDPANRRP